MKKLLYVLILSLFLMANMASAKSSMMNNAMSIIQEFSELAEEFNLTDEQKSEIRGVVISYIPGLAFKANAMMNHHQQLLNHSLGKDELDEAFVTEIAIKQGDLLSEIIISKEHMKKDIRSKLTEDQKQFVDELIYTILQLQLNRQS